MLVKEAKGPTDFPPRQAGMLSKLDGRLKPELDLSIPSLNVHAHPRFLAPEDR